MVLVKLDMGLDRDDSTPEPGLVKIPKNLYKIGLSKETDLSRVTYAMKLDRITRLYQQIGMIPQSCKY